MTNDKPLFAPSPADSAGMDSAIGEQMDVAPSDASNALDLIDTARMPELGASKGMLYAVSTLLALTPPGRVDELERLTALAHGFIGMAEEDALVTLAKAVATRDDLHFGLADRLARTNDRAAQTLIRANALSDECVASLIERRDGVLQDLLVRFHTLQPQHITMLVAGGNPTVIQALLDKRPKHLQSSGMPDVLVAEPSDKTEVGSEANRDAPPVFVNDHQSTLEDDWPFALDFDDDEAVIHEAADIFDVPEPASNLAPLADAQDSTWVATPPVLQRSSPAIEAKSYAQLDSAGRAAIVTRLNQDRPNTSMTDARRALDPTRHQADLTFLTIIEQRESKPLADAFANTLDLGADLVQRLLDEADGDALMVLSRAAGLSSTAFARMIILSKIGMTGSPRDTFALVDRFNALPESTALSIVSAMRDGDVVEVPQAPPSERRELDATLRQVTAAPPRATLPPPGEEQGFRRAV